VTKRKAGMKPRNRLFNVAVICALVVVSTGTKGRTADLISSAPQNTTTFCTAPEYHQFDFWVGDWDAFDFDNPNTKVARTKVDRILDGCVLRENYEGADGHEGQSLNVYDASRKLWHQSWVTNRGEMLELEGKYQDGAMVLSGSDHAKHGQLVRGTWTAVKGGVREVGETSDDGGKTWKPWFDIVFRPKTMSGGSAQ